MQPAYIFFALAILALIGAGVLFANAETKSYDEFVSFAKDADDNSKRAVEACKKMSGALDSFDDQLKALQMKTLPTMEQRLLEDIGRALAGSPTKAQLDKIGKELELVSLRQANLEKKSHSAAKVELTNGPAPIMVQVVKPKEVGKGQGALLKRAEVPPVDKE